MQHYCRYIFFSIIFLSFLSGCGTTAKTPVKLNEHIEVGWTPRSVLETKTFPWFDSAYTAYKPGGVLFSQIQPIKDSLSFLVIYGTWCSDSKREVPRFFKIMDSLRVAPSQITLFAVDRTIHYPPGPPELSSITHIPTIIFKYKGLEVGRIIETPKGLIEEDLYNQLSPLIQ